MTQNEKLLAIGKLLDKYRSHYGMYLIQETIDLIDQIAEIVDGEEVSWNSEVEDTGGAAPCVAQVAGEGGSDQEGVQHLPEMREEGEQGKGP